MQSKSQFTAPTQAPPQTDFATNAYTQARGNLAAQDKAGLSPETTTEDPTETPEVTGIAILDQAIAMGETMGQVVLEALPVPTVVNWYLQHRDVPLLQQWLEEVDARELLASGASALFDVAWPIGRSYDMKLEASSPSEAYSTGVSMQRTEEGFTVDLSLSFGDCKKLGFAIPGIEKLENNSLNLELSVNDALNVNAVWDIAMSQLAENYALAMCFKDAYQGQPLDWTRISSFIPGILKEIQPKSVCISETVESGAEAGVELGGAGVGGELTGTVGGKLGKEVGYDSDGYFIGISGELSGDLAGTLKLAAVDLEAMLGHLEGGASFRVYVDPDSLNSDAPVIQKWVVTLQGKVGQYGITLGASNTYEAATLSGLLSLLAPTPLQAAGAITNNSYMLTSEEVQSTTLKKGLRLKVGAAASSSLGLTNMMEADLKGSEELEVTAEATAPTNAIQAAVGDGMQVLGATNAASASSFVATSLLDPATWAGLSPYNLDAALPLVPIELSAVLNVSVGAAAESQVKVGEVSGLEGEVTVGAHFRASTTTTANKLREVTGQAKNLEATA